MNTINKIISILLLASIAITTYSCDDEPKPSTPPAHRTILVYIVANNSLGFVGCDSEDLTEMIEASQNNSFNGGRLIVYHSTLGAPPTLFEISNGNTTKLKEYDSSTLSVEATRMQQVIDDTKNIAPANDYGLILWSHGNGWLQTGIPNDTLHSSTPTKTPLAFGVDQGKQMNITTLAQVINDEGFNFIYFDCCYMSTVEVIYELRNATPYIVASAAEVPADGMPYDYNIPLLFEDTPNLLSTCTTTFDYYNSKNDDEFRSCTMSLIDTKYISELAAATANIYRLQPSLPADFKPQKFTLDTNCYYFDFGQYLEALSANNPQLFETWQQAIDKVVIYKAATPYMWSQLKLTHHSGLSTFILNSASSCTIKGYNQLQWWTDVASILWNTEN